MACAEGALEPSKNSMDLKLKLRHRIYVEPDSASLLVEVRMQSRCHLSLMPLLEWDPASELTHMAVGTLRSSPACGLDIGHFITLLLVSLGVGERESKTDNTVFWEPNLRADIPLSLLHSVYWT